MLKPSFVVECRLCDQRSQESVGTNSESNLANVLFKTVSLLCYFQQGNSRKTSSAILECFVFDCCINNNELKPLATFFQLTTSGHGPMILLSARGSVQSLACQLRVLSQNGCAPERSNVSALAEENCRSPFKFDSKTMLPKVKDALENYEGTINSKIKLSSKN